MLYAQREAQARQAQLAQRGGGKPMQATRRQAIGNMLSGASDFGGGPRGGVYGAGAQKLAGAQRQAGYEAGAQKLARPQAGAQPRRKPVGGLGDRGGYKLM